MELGSVELFDGAWNRCRIAELHERESSRPLGHAISGQKHSDHLAGVGEQGLEVLL